MADIGEEAGYSRGLANHHFGSRAELVDRLVRRTQSDFLAGLEAIGGDELRDLAELVGVGGELGAGNYRSEDGPVNEERLRWLARPTGSRVPQGLRDAGMELRLLATMTDGYLASVASGSNTVRAFVVMWGAAFPEDAALRPVLMADDAHFRRGVEEVVRLGQHNLTIKPDLDPVGVAVALVGMLRGIAAQFTVAPKDVDVTAARRACVRFLRDTLMPAPVPAAPQDQWNDRT